MDQVKFVEDNLLKFEVIWSAEGDHFTSIFLKAVYTWSILEYFVLYNL